MPLLSTNITDNNNTRVVDLTEYYFGLVYQCLDTRRNFLNVISLNSRNPVESNIDVAILQALLNGTKTQS